MATQYALAKVKGSDPETFMIVGVDLGEGKMKETSESMSEKEMRDFLAKKGVPTIEIDGMIQRARLDPK